jgi:tetratricopeptide (TPR) repeat protein
MKETIKMKHKAFLTIVLCIALSLSCSQGLDELNNEYLPLLWQGKYHEAGEVAASALALAEETFGPEHTDVVLPLENLAEAYGHQGRYDEAELLYRRAL